MNMEKDSEMMDIIGPHSVQVSIDAARRRLWVNVNGRCMFRVGQVEQSIEIEDQAEELLPQVPYTQRDIEAKPYTPDEQRVAEWFAEKGVGGGDDPIGFLMASVTYCTSLLNQYRAKYGDLPD